MTFLRHFFTGILILALLACSGCGYDENKGLFMAPGSYSDLAVVVSQGDLEPLANRFLETFNTTKTFVIQEETNFLPDIYLPERWDLCKGYKNSLFLVRIGDGGPVEKAVRKSLPKETWEKLASGGGGVVKLNDPWASYQLVVVVASRDRNNLGSLLTKNRSKIQDIFASSSRDRILRRNRYEGLNLPVMDDHWQRFGFFMETPLDFERIQFLPDGYHGIEMMKKGPSRGITVTWQASEDPAGQLLDIDSLAAMRTEMGERMHQEEVHPETFVWEATEIGGVECMRLEGAWTSRKFAGGGAFWCYFIPDPARNRLFCVDLLVYAPGMDKMNFFKHLDAIASTFTTHRPQP